jgi:superfamily II DNA helicase RecQ
VPEEMVEKGIVLLSTIRRILKNLKRFWLRNLFRKEIGLQLLNEVVGYVETSMSRRQYLSVLFGEKFDPVNGAGAKMCDNSVNPPVLKDASKDLTKILSLVNDLGQKFRAKIWSL